MPLELNNPEDFKQLTVRLAKAAIHLMEMYPDEEYMVFVRVGDIIE